METDMRLCLQGDYEASLYSEMILHSDVFMKHLYFWTRPPFTLAQQTHKHQNTVGTWDVTRSIIWEGRFGEPNMRLCSCGAGHAQPCMCFTSFQTNLTTTEFG